MCMKYELLFLRIDINFDYFKLVLRIFTNMIYNRPRE